MMLGVRLVCQAKRKGGDLEYKKGNFAHFECGHYQEAKQDSMTNKDL